ncbi:hypothetical protein CBM2588_A210206 [Cupriavidus taiwanensis]|nr:hypothetical protein CBM2588_A210206 [Cupriavidus taiwanensis]SOY84538.1 hypothetical protein CBM2591_A300207 [Cupriavidus taiwanensis]SOZ59995.1 hypothetical protein CBM2617_A310003 [Cupriavidus taiwanensis]SOZ80450.1 hypothetical protein CBM2618_A280003 [Cupriavidus taiwanensis]SOZ81176.1 hypothetical protein CBM2622_A240204 [Cupriavidus taiwanensis]
MPGGLCFYTSRPFVLGARAMRCRRLTDE